jgi:hypothetical protein
MHAGFAQFAAFDQDAIDNRAFLARGRLQMPVLAIGGDHSFGSTMAFVVRFAADDVREVVIANSGHWLMEEQPGPTIAAIRAFLQSGASSGALPKTRLTAAQVDATARGAGGAGTSGVSGVQTTVLSGDPNAPGPYAIEIRVPPHTRIAAHRHRDNRTATSFPANGILAMAKTPAKPQPPRLGRAASYTEPASVAHLLLPATRRPSSTSPGRARPIPNTSTPPTILHVIRSGPRPSMVSGSLRQILRQAIC